MSDVMIAEAHRAERPGGREYSVLVAPYMRALYREARAGHEVASVPTRAPFSDAVLSPETLGMEPPELDVASIAAPVGAVRAETTSGPSPTFEDGAPVSDQSLRWDGKRPLHFRGMLVASGAVESKLASGAHVRQSLSLWWLVDGGAVLAISLECVDALALRPLHRLTVFPSAIALGSVLESHDPSDAFPDIPFMNALALADVRRDAGQLRRDFLKLAGLALGAFPNGREIEKEPTQ